MTLFPNVAEGVHRIEDCYTNFYLVEDKGRITVVDACVPTSWNSLRSALTELGRSLDDIDAVVLTHAHFDHVGCAERARSELGVPVYVHENDAPMTSHPWRYDYTRRPALYVATQVRALPIVAAFLRNRALWPSPVKEVTRFTDGVLPVPGAPEVIFTPGHTLGSCAIHLPDRDAIIVGDTIVTLDPYTAKRGPRLVARAATVDVQRNLGSLTALEATGARVVLTGHGDPWTDGIESAVAAARSAGSA